jgi:hypothetical protein
MLNFYQHKKLPTNKDQFWSTKKDSLSLREKGITNWPLLARCLQQTQQKLKEN